MGHSGVGGRNDECIREHGIHLHIQECKSRAVLYGLLWATLTCH